MLARRVLGLKTSEIYSWQYSCRTVHKLLRYVVKKWCIDPTGILPTHTESSPHCEEMGALHGSGRCQLYQYSLDEADRTHWWHCCHGQRGEYPRKVQGETRFLSFGKRLLAEKSRKKYPAGCLATRGLGACCVPEKHWNCRFLGLIFRVSSFPGLPCLHSHNTWKCWSFASVW